MENTIFTLENIEKAACSLSIVPPPPEAMALLNEWTQRPESLITAIFLLKNSKNYNAQFIASSLIKNNVNVYWQKMNNDIKNVYRNILFEYAINSPFNANITYNLIDAINTIAIFDWPNDFQIFSQIFTPLNNQSFIKTAILILRCFLEKIDKTKIITERHRYNLQKYIISNFQKQIWIIIKNCILIQELTASILSIISYILKWESERNVIDLPFLKIICQFVTNEETCKNAVACLHSIFFERFDSEIAFIQFSPFIIEFFSKGLFVNDTLFLSYPVIKFILIFFAKYSSIIHLSLCHNQESKGNLNEIKIAKIQQLLNSYQANNLSLANINEDLINIYRIILSIQPEKIDIATRSLLLKFWECTLPNLNSTLKDVDESKASFAILMPIYNEIMQSIFNSLSIFSEEKDDSTIAQNILRLIYEMNPDAYTTFIKSQPPSENLCYAIQNFVLQNHNSDLYTIFDGLIQYSNINQSPKFTCAFLNCFSQCSVFVNYNQHFFTQFVQFIFNLFSSNDESVVDSATKAFSTIACTQKEFFTKEIIECVIGRINHYFLSLNKKFFKRIFISCLKIITRINDQHLISLNAQLFEPILIVLNNPSQFEVKTVASSVYLISRICKKSLHFIKTFVKPLFPQLLSLSAIYLPNLSIDDRLLNDLLNSIYNVQKTLTFEEVCSQVKVIINLMISRGSIEDCFFRYFAHIRLSFSEFDSFYSDIHKLFVLPSLEGGGCCELFQMIGKFSQEVVGIEWLIKTVFMAVNELSSEVGEAALFAFNFNLSNSKKEQCILYMTKYAFNLVNEIIESAVNLVHKQLLMPIVSVLAQLISLIDNFDFDPEFVRNAKTFVKNAIVEALKKSGEEPASGVFKSFAQCLFDLQAAGEELYLDAFYRLLVAMKKVSSCTAEEFEIRRNKMYRTFIKSKTIERPKEQEDYGELRNIQL